MLRLQWVALLEFSHNKEVTEFSWQNMDTRLLRTDKLRDMVHHGVPHSLRPQIWMRMSGILQFLYSITIFLILQIYSMYLIIYLSIHYKININL